MRIITGLARGRRLFTPTGMDVRPTTDKVKEAMFNIIQFELEGRRVLDLFAGTGQLGLEAISRGASFAVFVDASRQSLDTVKKNIAATGFSDYSKTGLSDAFGYLSAANETFDIVFLDPPYEQKLCEKASPLLGRVLKPTSIVICETRVSETMPETMGHLPRDRDHLYGSVKLTLYRQ